MSESFLPGDRVRVRPPASLSGTSDALGDVATVVASPTGGSGMVSVRMRRSSESVAGESADFVAKVSIDRLQRLEPGQRADFDRQDLSSSQGLSTAAGSGALPSTKPGRASEGNGEILRGDQEMSSGPAGSPIRGRRGSVDRTLRSSRGSAAPGSSSSSSSSSDKTDGKPSAGTNSIGYGAESSTSSDDTDGEDEDDDAPPEQRKARQQVGQLVKVTKGERQGYVGFIEKAHAGSDDSWLLFTVRLGVDRVRLHRRTFRHTSTHADLQAALAASAAAGSVDAPSIQSPTGGAVHSPTAAQAGDTPTEGSAGAANPKPATKQSAVAAPPASDQAAYPPAPPSTNGSASGSSSDPAREQSHSSSRPQPVQDPSDPDMSAAEAEAASLRLAAELQAMERRTSGRRRRPMRSSDPLGSVGGSTDAGDARSVSTAGTRTDGESKHGGAGRDELYQVQAGSKAPPKAKSKAKATASDSVGEHRHSAASSSKQAVGASASGHSQGETREAAGSQGVAGGSKERKRVLTGDQWIGQAVRVVGGGLVGTVTGSGHGFFKVEFDDGSIKKHRKAQLVALGPDGEPEASEEKPEKKYGTVGKGVQYPTDSGVARGGGKTPSDSRKARSGSVTRRGSVAGESTAYQPPRRGTGSQKGTPKRRDSLEGAEEVAKQALATADQAKSGGAGSRLRNRLAALGEGMQQELSRRSRTGSLTSQSEGRRSGEQAGGSDVDAKQGDSPAAVDSSSAAPKNKGGKHAARASAKKASKARVPSAKEDGALRAVSTAEAAMASGGASDSDAPNRPSLRIVGSKAPAEAPKAKSYKSHAKYGGAARQTSTGSTSSATSYPAPKTPVAAAPAGRKRPRRAAAVSASQALAGYTPMANEEDEEKEGTAGIPPKSGVPASSRVIETRPTSIAAAFAPPESSADAGGGGRRRGDARAGGKAGNAPRSLLRPPGGPSGRVGKSQSVTIQPIATVSAGRSAGRSAPRSAASQRTRTEAAPLPPTTPATVYTHSDDEGAAGARDADASAASSRKRRRLERERKAVARATDQGVARVNKMLAHHERLRLAVQRAKDWYAKEGRPDIGHYKHRLDLPSLEELYLDFQDWKMQAAEAVASAREIVADQVAELEAEGIVIGLHDLSSDDAGQAVGTSSDDPLAAPVSLVRMASLMEPEDAMTIGMSSATASPKTPASSKSPVVAGVKHKPFGLEMKGPVPPIVPEHSASSSQRSASGVSAVLSRMGAHQKEAWLSRRKALIYSAVAAAEAAALSACLAMRSTGYQPGEYALTVAYYETLNPAQKAAETAARAVLVGYGAVDMLYGKKSARSLMALPREVAVDGYAFKHGRSTAPGRGHQGLGPGGLAAVLQTAVAPSVFPQAMRGSGWTPRPTNDDGADAADAVLGQEPSDRDIVRLARSAREMDVYGTRSAGAIHSEVLGARMEQLNGHVEASARAPLLEDPPAGVQSKKQLADRAARRGMQDEDDEEEEEDPVEPTATIQPVALAIDLASGDSQPKDPFGTDPIGTTGAPQFASLTEALLAADTANAVNRPSKPVLHWRLGSQRLERAVTMARGIPLAEMDASSDEEDSDEEIPDSRKTALDASETGGRGPDTIGADHFSATASKQYDAPLHGLRDVPWHVWQRNVRGKSGFGAVSRWDDTWQYLSAKRPALEPGSEPWVFGPRPLSTAGEYLALAAAQERASLHHGRRRLRTQAGGLPSAGGSAAAEAEAVEGASPLQSEIDAVAHLDEGELDGGLPERGMAPALTPAAAGPLGSDPFGVHGADAFGGVARSRERDWNALPTIGAPSLAGAFCPACGFQKESETDHCWNEDCPLCPLAVGGSEDVRYSGEGDSSNMNLNAAAYIGRAGLRAFAAAVAAAESWTPAEKSAGTRTSEPAPAEASEWMGGTRTGRGARGSDGGKAAAARQAAADVLSQIGAAGAGKAAADMLVSMGPSGASQRAKGSNAGWSYGVVDGSDVEAGLHGATGSKATSEKAGAGGKDRSTAESRGAAADAARMDSNWAYALVQAASGHEVRHASLAALAAATAKVLSAELVHGTAAEAGIVACSTRAPAAAGAEAPGESSSGPASGEDNAAGEYGNHRSDTAASRCAGLLASLGLKANAAAKLAAKLGGNVSDGMGAAIALEALLDSTTACRLAGVTRGDARAWWVREQERPDIEAARVRESVQGGAAWARTKTKGATWRAKLPAGPSAPLAALTVPRRRLRGYSMLEGWRPVVSQEAIQKLDYEESDAIAHRKPHEIPRSGDKSNPGPSLGSKRQREDSASESADSLLSLGLGSALPSVARRHVKGAVRPRLMLHAEWVAVDEACRDVFAREYDYASAHDDGGPAPPMLGNSGDGIQDDVWEARKGAVKEDEGYAAARTRNVPDGDDARLGLPTGSQVRDMYSSVGLETRDSKLASASSAGVTVGVSNSREAALLIWEGGRSLAHEREGGGRAINTDKSSTMEQDSTSVPDDLRRDSLALRPGPVPVLPSLHEVRQQVFRRAVTALRISRLQHGCAVQQCLTEGLPPPVCPYRTVDPEHVQFRSWAEAAIRHAAEAGVIQPQVVRDAVSSASGCVALPWKTAPEGPEKRKGGRSQPADGTPADILASFRAWMLIGPPPENDDEDGLPEPVWKDGTGEDLPPRPDCEVYARHAPPPDLSFVRAAIWNLPLPVHALLHMATSQGGLGRRKESAGTSTGLSYGISGRRSASPTGVDDDMAVKALVGVGRDTSLGVRRRSTGWSTGSVHPLSGLATVMFGEVADAGSASSSSTDGGAATSVLEKEQAVDDYSRPSVGAVPAHDEDFGDLLQPLIEMQLPLPTPALPSHMLYFLRPTKASLAGFSTSNRGLRKLLQRMPPPFSGPAALAASCPPDAVAFHRPPGKYRPGAKARPIQGAGPQPPAHVALAAGHDPAGGPMTVLSVPRGAVRSARTAQHGGPRGGIPPSAHAAAASTLVLASEAAAAAERAGLSLAKDDDSLSMLNDNPRYTAAATASHVGGGYGAAPPQSGQLLKAARQQADQQLEEYYISMMPQLHDGTPNPHYNPSSGLPRPRGALQVLEDEAAKAVANEHSGVHAARQQRTSQSWTGGRLQPDSRTDPLGGGPSIDSAGAEFTDLPSRSRDAVDGGDGYSPDGDRTGPALSYAKTLESRNAKLAAGISIGAASSGSVSTQASAQQQVATSQHMSSGDGITSWGRGQPVRAHVNLLGAGLTRVYAPEASRVALSDDMEARESLVSDGAQSASGQASGTRGMASNTRGASQSSGGAGDLHSSDSIKKLLALQAAARVRGGGAGTGANSSIARLAMDAPVHVLGQQRAPRDPWHPSASGRTVVPFVLPFKPELPAALQDIPSVQVLLQEDSSVDPSAQLAYSEGKYGRSGAYLRALHQRITERTGRKAGRKPKRSQAYLDRVAEQDELQEGGAPAQPTASLMTLAEAGTVAGCGIGMDAGGGLQGASLAARGTGEGPTSIYGHGTGEGWLGRHVRSFGPALDAVNRFGIGVALGDTPYDAQASSSSSSLYHVAGEGEGDAAPAGVVGIDLPHPDEAAAAVLLAASRKELSLEEATESRQGAVDLLAQGHAVGLHKFLRDCRKRRRESVLSAGSQEEGLSSRAGGSSGYKEPAAGASTDARQRGASSDDQPGAKRHRTEATSEIPDTDGSAGKFEAMTSEAAKGVAPGWMRTVEDGGPKDYFYPGDGTRVCTLSGGPHAFVLRMPAVPDPDVEEGPPTDEQVDEGVSQVSRHAEARFLEQQRLQQEVEYAHYAGYGAGGAQDVPGTMGGVYGGHGGQQYWIRGNGVQVSHSELAEQQWYMQQAMQQHRQAASGEYPTQSAGMPFVTTVTSFESDYGIVGSTLAMQASASSASAGEQGDVLGDARSNSGFDRRD